jgi:ketosteroid isomerase-like protein
MKTIVILSCLCITAQLHAQKGVDGIINAEKSFAAYSVEHGTKDAFLKFLDSSAIVFEAKQPVNGIEAWTKKEKRPGILNWQPQFAEVSSSGDFGYTSGPWTFQPNTINDSIVARGQFNSVWRMNKNGEWKNILDIGNNMPTTTPVALVKIDAPKISEKPLNLMALQQAEEAFIKLVKKDASAAYQKYISKQSILNHNGSLPATTDVDQKQLIAATPMVDYKISGSGIAISGDLGYVYGSSQSGDKKDSYLRVWRKEKEGWKIALEVLHH